MAAAEPDGFHLDPADRLIVSIAVDEGRRVLTSDRRILIWLGALDRADARR